MDEVVRCDLTDPSGAPREHPSALCHAVTALKHAQVIKIVFDWKKTALLPSMWAELLLLQHPSAGTLR